MQMPLDSLSRCRLLLLLLLLAGNLSAASRYYFKQISLQDGLSQSSVKCVLVDGRGILWIGTRFGLNQFDREIVMVYREEKNNASSLPGNDIVLLKEDAARNIWVGTTNGLARFDPTTWKFERQTIVGKPLMATCCCLLPEGICFLGRQGVFLYRYKDREIIACPLKGKFPVLLPNYAFLQEEERKILFSSYGNGLWWYYPETGETERVPYVHEKNISSLYVDAQGKIWVAVYDQGVYVYDHDGRLLEHLKAPEKLTHNVVQDIQEKDGVLWLATDGGGINLYHPEDRSVEVIRHTPGDPYSLPVNSFACLYSDNENNIWAGSIRGGLIGIKPVSMTTYREAPPGASYGLSFPSVTSMFEDTGGNIWMGTDGGGLNLFDPDEETFQKYPSTNDMKIVSILPYSESALLLSLFGTGLCLFDKKSGECREYRLNWGKIPKDLFRLGNSVRLLRVDESHFCLLSDNRFYLYDQRNETFEAFPKEKLPRNLWTPRFLSGDSCYLTTSTDLHLPDFRQGVLRPVFRSQGKIGTITAVEQGTDKRFWIGTTDGLFVYDRIRQQMDTVDTERISGVMSLAFDSRERLWISTHEGLYAYIPREKRTIIFSPSDGVFTREFLQQPVLKASSGDLYMAGVEGVVRIRSGQDFSEDKDFSIGLVNLALDGQSIHPDSISGEPVLSVPWDHTSLSLSVIVKENDLMRKKLYRFSIRGERTEEMESYSQSFTFPALSPGYYELWVSYSKKNGDWSAPSKLLSVRVIPPLWKRGWFQATVLLFLLLIAGGGVWMVWKRKERELDWKLKEHERKSYEEKVRFLINISHELRTPLTLIYAPLKRLMASGLVADESLSRLLEGILLQTRRIREIVDLALDAQKSDAHDDVLDIRLQDLNGWLRTVVDDFALELRGRNIQLVFRLDPSVEKLSFDAAKCRIVLSNLLMNAIKFSDSDSELELSTKRMETRVRISLSDQGIGLGGVDKTRLFSPFYQGDHDRKGSGIGLAYARKLVEQQGGSIGAFDNEELGATFYFDLPTVQTLGTVEEEMATDGFQGNPNRKTDEQSAEADVFPLQSSTLLLAEDEPELRDYLSSILQAEFKRVYMAEDGMRAWNLLGQCQPDIVVSDVMMPGMDGFELCRRLKNDLAVSHIPVVLLTACADSESMSLGYKSGADVYLAKPFDIDFLLTVIRNLLKRRDLLRSRYREANRLFSPKEDAISNADEQFMQKLNVLIRDNLNNPDLNVPFLASAMAMSRTTLYSKFGNLSDVPVGDYIIRFRIAEATRLLAAHQEMSIQEIADRTGFSSARYFSTAFRQSQGVSPTEYRKKSCDFRSDFQKEHLSL